MFDIYFPSLGLVSGYYRETEHCGGAADCVGGRCGGHGPIGSSSPPRGVGEGRTVGCGLEIRHPRQVHEDQT